MIAFILWAVVTGAALSYLEWDLRRSKKRWAEDTKARKLGGRWVEDEWVPWDETLREEP